MHDPASMTRRTLLSTAAAGACALCSCAHDGGAPAQRARPAAPVDVGPLDRFARQGVYDQWAGAHGFFIVRRENRVYALSAVCTHREYDLEAQGAQIICPKHGSLFTPAGDVTKGPAIKPLPRFAIRLTPAQTVVVDPGRRFAPAESNQPGAFIAAATSARS